MGKKETPLMRYTYRHLPEKLQSISKPFAELAQFVDNLDAVDIASMLPKA